MNESFFYICVALIFVFSLTLLRDEIIFGRKTIKEMIITFPFLILIEFSHFGGSCAGLLKFRILKKSIIN